MSENPESVETAHPALREQRLRRAGTLIGRAVSLVMLIGGLAIFARTLGRAGEGPWTSISLASLFLGLAFRGLWSLLDVHERNARVAVPLTCFTAAVFAVSAVASLGALLLESLVPAIFLAPASLAIAVFHVVLARALALQRDAA